MRVYGKVLIYMFIDGASPRKLILGLPPRIRRLKAKHMPPLIVRLRIRPTILPRRHVDDVVVPPTPGRAGRISGREDDVLEVSPLRAEHHDAVRVEHGDPQVAVGADIISW